VEASTLQLQYCLTVVVVVVVVVGFDLIDDVKC
jgi:hypothetical protein